MASAYGLSCQGIPLVFWAVVNFCRADNWKKNVFYSLFILLYALFSSLILAGFAVFILLGIGILVFLFHKKIALALRLIYCSVLLLIVYIPANLAVFMSTFFPGCATEVSHRVEFDFVNLHYLNFFKQTCVMFILGQDAAASKHIFILLFVCMLCALVFFLPWFFKKAVISEYVKKTYKILIIIITAAFAIAVFYGFYRFSAIGLALRAKYLPDALGSFAFERVYWFYPAMFYIAAGLGFELLWRLVADQKGVISDSLYRRCRIGAAAVICCVAVATLLYSALAKENVLFLNVRTLFYDVSAKNRNAGNINNMTWDEYWAVDLFEQAAKDIPEAKDKFRVISIGMSPEPSLYNGFYALDAYSNNYPLNYKHKFRKIIADELAQSPRWKTYFDHWGNRCYAFSHELEFSRYHKSADAKIHNFCFDLKTFKDMGGKYIFSGVEIVNPEKYGLTLCGSYKNDKSFIVCIYIVVTFNAK